MKKLLVLLVAICCFNGIKADEGMWMLSHVSPQSMKIMKDLGLELSKKELYNPKGSSLKDAVVAFGGFCSGVIVSPDGLVFTNHHCGFGNIQALATPENDILKNGFVARTQADELPAKGLFVRLLQRTDDITKDVMKAYNKAYKKMMTEKPELTNAEIEKFRSFAIDSICNEIENKYNKKYPKLISEVESYYTGNEFYINIYKQYDDIRLVFAPPQSLGKFGGETDNWMWPRQTCDFSVFRIYSDNNNEPAEYSATNRPLQAKRYAKISLDGYEKGDYCMTIGYPGSTDRYLSSFGITEQMECGNAARINVRGVKQDVWKRWMNSDATIRLQYASKYAQSSNYWKNNIGMNKALKDLGVVEQKQAKEKQITEWAKKKKSTNVRFGNIISELSEAYKSRKEAVYALSFLQESFPGGPDMFRIANYYNHLQKAVDNDAKESLKNRIRTQYKDRNEQVDKETMIVLMENYAKQVKPEYLPSFYEIIKNEYNQDYTAFVNDMFSKTFLNNPNCIDSTFTEEQVKNDMAMACLNSVQELGAKLKKQISTANLTVSENERKLCQAIVEMEFDRPHYSDANFTMRLSYGFVNDYTSAEGHQNYYTTMPSILEKIAKCDEIDEYWVEPEVKTLFEKGNFGPYKDEKTGEMQLCFLSNNDITGGNSGSPMFNGKGELIGLAFDGNWDAMSSDVSFTQDLTRCIGVDIRYVLYIIDCWGGADRLIKEMGVK
ncbi:MAG: S46 family peptidase [Paraprevotella sp.]|nr:S46 family peptidase [Paraprevotella sp.]